MNEPLTPRAKNLLTNAANIAKNHNHNYIGSEHLLVAALQFEHGACPELRKRLRLKNTIGQRAVDTLKKMFRQ